MTDGGFIVVHRKIQSSPDWLALRGDQRSVFMSLLLLANWKPGFFWYGTHRVEVGRGELAHSVETIAKHARVTKKVTRTTVDHLLRRAFLGSRPGTPAGNGPRILTIVNYDRYQDIGDPAGTPTGDDVGESRAQPGHAAGTPRALIEPCNQEEPVNQEALKLAVARKPRRKAPRAGDQGRRDADKPADPRRAPLVASLCQIFSEERGGDRYVFKGKRDGAAVTVLLGYGADAEIEKRWRLGLRQTGFHRLNYLHELEAKWNAYAGKGPGAPVAPTLAQPSPLREVAGVDDEGNVIYREGACTT